MSKASPAQLSFNAGLLSPQVDSRLDLPKYEYGCLDVVRFLPEIEGPLVKCPGTKFIAPQHDETARARMIRFEFSVLQTYQLEFGDETLRVFRNQSLILDSAHTPATVDSVSAADPLEISVSSTGLNTGDMVYITGTATPQINGQFFRITVVGPTNITLDGVDGSSFNSHATVAGTIQKVYQITSPYSESDLPKISFAQDKDVVYLACEGHPRRKLSRTADDAWTFTTITGAEIDTDDESLGSWPPFADFSTSGAKLYIAADTAPGGSTTVTSDTAGTFTVNDIGRYLKIQTATAEAGYGLITAFTDDQNVTVTVYSRFPGSNFGPGNPYARFDTDLVGSGNASAEWAFSAFDEVNGYPKCLTFYDDRLYWASNDDQVQTFWASVSDDFENHRPYGPSPTDPEELLITGESSLRVTLRSKDMNAIVWMEGLDELFIGTRGGEWVLSPQNPEEVIGPGNFKVKPRGRSGARAPVAPVSIDSVVLFVQRAGRKLKEFVYRSASNTYDAVDMTRLSREATLGRVKYMAFQQEPNKVLWVVLENGDLRTLTYERADDVVAWAKQPLAGEGVEVESVSTTPTEDDDEDEVWVTVKRTVNGETRRYVEVFQKFWDRQDLIEDAFFLDAGSTYSGAAATTIYGLMHLIGETVRVWADGASLPDETVDENGSVTLDSAATKVHIGLGYNARFTTKRFEAGARDGTAQGKLKRIHRVVTRLYQTAPGLWFGPSYSKMDEIPFRDPEDPMDALAPLFDGDTESLPMRGGSNQEGAVYYEHRSAGPCSVRAVYPQLDTSDRN